MGSRGADRRQREHDFLHSTRWDGQGLHPPQGFIELTGTRALVIHSDEFADASIRPDKPREIGMQIYLFQRDPKM